MPFNIFEMSIDTLTEAKLLAFFKGGFLAHLYVITYGGVNISQYFFPKWNISTKKVGGHQ